MALKVARKRDTVNGASPAFYPSINRPPPLHISISHTIFVAHFRLRASEIVVIDILTMADNTPTNYVTLVSNDGYEFKILRSAACIAGTIKKALDPMCTL